MSGEVWILNQGLGKGSGDSQVMVKYKKYSEIDIGGRQSLHKRSEKFFTRGGEGWLSEFCH